MTERMQLDSEPEPARARDQTVEPADATAPLAAVIRARASLPLAPGGGGTPGPPLARARGATPAFGRAIVRLQGTAGNAAVARLLAGRAATHHREAQARVHAAPTAISEAPVNAASTVAASLPTSWAPPSLSVQTEDGDAPAPAAATESGAEPMGGGAPPPGPSWTKVGPPTRSSFAVSGTLREVATALEARKEAGSTTPTPTMDTETWTPESGEERITAARVTVTQVVDLPSWTDKAAATANQQAEWNRFSGAISTHEDGHVATDRKSFANAHAKILRKTPADGDAELAKVDTKAKADNDAYDVATGSGKSQGTDINANIDEVTKVP